MSDTSETECRCFECMRNPAVTDDDDDLIPQTEDRLPIPDYSKFTLGTIAARRLRRPDILDSEILIPEGPAPGSFMDRLSRLSVELVAEVLGWLHPVELVYMSYMTKDFRTLLQSNRIIWTMARIRFPIPLPECPAPVTGEEWVLMLFNHKCNFCGDFGERVLWSLGLTICSGCFPCKLCTPLSMKALPGLQGSDWRELRHITRFSANKQWWLKHDIVVSARLLEDFKSRCRNGDDGALEEYELFKQRRIEQVEAWNDFRAACVEWQLGLDSTLSGMVSYSRRNDVKRRLEAEGFDLTGVNLDVWMHPDLRHNCRTHPELTDDEWKRAGPFFRKMATTGHRAYLTRKRLGEISAFAADILLDFATVQSRPAPRLSHVVTWPVFTAAKDIEVTPNLSPDILEALRSQLLTSLVEWSTSETGRLIRMVPGNTKAPLSARTIRLRLLTTIFKCSNTPYWPPYTFEDICGGKHQTGGDDFSCLEFDHDTSRVIRELVEAADLDARSATADSLDAVKDHRFFCRDCPKGPEPRSCSDSIEHFFTAHKWGRSFNGWTRQAQKDVLQTKWVEVTRARIYGLPSLNCRLCDLTDAMAWSALVEHLRIEHHKDEGSIQNTDYEVDETLRSQGMPRGGATRSQDENSQRNKTLRVLKCTHCQASVKKRERSRRFDLTALINHAKIKHEILYVQDADFIEVPRVQVPAEDDAE